MDTQSTGVTRRQVLAAAGAFAISAALGRVAVGQSTQPGMPMNVLFFTKSSGFQHDVIKRNGDELGHAERVLVELGAQHGFNITASKDGRVFEPDVIGKWDAFVFYTTGDLTETGNDGTPAMSAAGKQALLDAITAGKGFIGVHCASDTFKGPQQAKQDADGKPQYDPFIQMVGGRFTSHGQQQKATLSIADRSFPGIGQWDKIELLEEWYAFDQLADDLHVILTQETHGMEGPMYQRPPYPNTWARMHGNGRVFYTGMGHREDVWTDPIFQSVLMGGMNWACGKVDAPGVK